uniref:Flagellin n=1 Tax=Rhodopseudomonas palustris (strain BisA53) TaxID=316055 RepID=Q07TJ6_RHOP5
MPVISTNTAANTAVRYLNVNSAQESSSLAKLSSGSKINKASDDAAGLAISTRISSDITTLQQASTNASQASSILQTADGGASNISDILARMKSLATQAASGTVTASSRTYIDSEFKQLIAQIDSIASGTRYSNESLLDGTSSNFAGSGSKILVGTSASDTITVALASLTSTTLALGTSTVATQADAVTAAAAIDTAINTVSKARADIGALESRFNFSSDSISTQIENLDAAKSAITDVDIASEQAKLSSAEVLVQAAVSAESAANQMPQYLLKLLG